MIQWFQKKMNKKGFTLIELVIVIAILGLLAAVAIPRLSGSRQNAAINSYNSNVRVLEGAANTYLSEIGLPTADVTWDGTAGQEWENYMQDWPSIPAGTGDATVDAATGYEVVIYGPGDDAGLIKVSPGKFDADGTFTAFSAD